VFSASLFIPAVIASIISYLLGSVSAAVLICRLMNLPDPRDSGSGNPGATNVLRVGGKLPAALTLLGDALKGLLPVAITGLIVPHAPTVALVAMAAFLGHLYPVFFDFRGGKGVATALGGLFGLSMQIGLLASVSWLVICLAFRISSVAALLTFTLVPLFLLTAGHTAFALVYVVIAGFLYYSHRENIQRILAGTEPKLGKSKISQKTSQ